MTNRKWVIVFIGAAFLYALMPILTPFFLGILIAYLGDPVVSCMQRWYMPRTLGVVIVFVVLLLLIAAGIFLLIPLFEHQLSAFMRRLPAMIDWVQDKLIPWLNQHIDIKAKLSLANIKEKLVLHGDKVQGVLSSVTQSVTQSTVAVMGFIANLLLVPVVAFYLLRDWPRVKSGLAKLIPSQSRKVVLHLADHCDEVVGAFFKGQLMVMIGLACVYSVGLWLIGLPVAFAIGLVSGLVAIVPYLGFLVGIVAASVAMYLETHQISHLFLVWGVYIVGQACESMIFTPLFVGDRIGLHPVAVIFAVMAGGTLFGFIGILLALPVSAVIMVLLKYWLLEEGGESAVSP